MFLYSPGLPKKSIEELGIFYETNIVSYDSFVQILRGSMQTYDKSGHFNESLVKLIGYFSKHYKYLKLLNNVHPILEIVMISL